MVYKSKGSGEIPVDENGEGTIIINEINGRIYGARLLPGEAANTSLAVDFKFDTSETATVSNVEKPSFAKLQVPIDTADYGNLSDSKKNMERPICITNIRVKVRNAMPNTIFNGVVVYFEE